MTVQLFINSALSSVVIDEAVIILLQVIKERVIMTHSETNTYEVQHVLLSVHRCTYSLSSKFGVVKTTSSSNFFTLTKKTQDNRKGL